MDRADEAHCAACHSPRGDMLALSEGHIAAAALYHGQAEVLDTVSPSGACLKCHDDESQSYWKGATLGGGIAIAEHASHPVGMTVQPGSGEAPRRLRDRIDARLPLFNGRMECQTCHLLTAKTVDLVVPFDEPYDMCLGCHRFPGRGADRKPQSPRLASRTGDVP